MVTPWSGNDSEDGIPELPPDALDDRYPYMRSICSPIGSGGGGPYCMVRAQCESGVRIKILESGLRNLNPYAFALLLV
jgi:hypothetical protein